MAKIDMIRLQVVVSLSLAHLVLGAPVVLAQSKEDTVEFLEAYADDSQQVKVAGCTAIIWTWAVDGKAREIVQLNAIDPATISQPVEKDDWVTSRGKRGKIYKITFKTVNKRKAITLEFWEEDGTHSLPQDRDEGALLVGKTPELAERLRKAFEHLVRLCGGKEEPF